MVMLAALHHTRLGCLRESRSVIPISPIRHLDSVGLAIGVKTTRGVGTYGPSTG